MLKIYNDIFEATQFGKVIFDQNGRFFRVNTKAKSFLSEMSMLDFKNMSQSDFLNYLYDHAVDPSESVRNVVLDYTAQVQGADFREVVHVSEGRICLVNARNLSKGKSIFTFSDVTSWSTRERDLLMVDQLNRQLHHAIQEISSGVVIGDPKVKGCPILFANSAFFDFVKCESDDLHHVGWQILGTLIHDDEEIKKFRSALRRFKSVELSLEDREDSNIRYYNLKLSPVYDQRGDLDLYVGVLSDVTVLKQRESEFFHAQKLESLGQLAAGVAHDFNNILSIISGYSLAVSKGLRKDQDKLRKDVEKITLAADRGAGLTRKMLTFSRHKVVTKEVVDVRGIVEEHSELCKPLLSSDVSIGVEVGAESLNVRGNVVSISQILMNLVINARDAMSGEGTIILSASACHADDAPERIRSIVAGEDYVCLNVSDTGSGMDEETLSRIFDPFYTTKDKSQGTGLGLSVVYGLVHEMGGAIDVSSAVGQGTTFSIYIPRCYQDATKAILRSMETGNSVRLDGYCVLLVEDEPDLLEIVGTMLEDAGMTVLSALNGSDALVLQDDYIGQIDLLLTDVVMPELSGVKLAELVRAVRPEIKTIFMSGFPSSGDMSPISLPDAAEFVAKPVHYEDLLCIIFYMLSEQIKEGVYANETPRWIVN